MGDPTADMIARNAHRYSDELILDPTIAVPEQVGLVADAVFGS
jgi:hypothetical protein